MPMTLRQWYLRQAKSLRLKVSAMGVGPWRDQHINAVKQGEGRLNIVDEPIATPQRARRILASHSFVG